MRKTWFFTLCVMLVLFCWTSSSHAFEIKKAKNIQRADLLGVVGEVEKSNMVSRMKKKLEKWSPGLQSSYCEPRCLSLQVLRWYDKCVMGIPLGSIDVNCSASGNICYEGRCIEPCVDTDGLRPSDPSDEGGRALTYGGEVTYYDPDEGMLKKEIDRCKIINERDPTQNMIYEYGCREGVVNLSEGLVEWELKECREGLKCLAIGAGDPARCVRDPDGDNIPNDCFNDNCPDVANPDQVDSDGDGIGNACEDDHPDQRDNDGDGIADIHDNCLGRANPDQLDSDRDCWGDKCDNCPELINPGQFDMDDDSWGNLCDNCPGVENADQFDEDGDGLGEACCFVHFVDENLERKVLDYVGGDGPVLCREARQVTGLVAEDLNISDLTGLEYFHDLKTLYIKDNNVSDLMPISGLQRLKTLSACGNPLGNVDLVVVPGLRLEFLGVGGRGITDISPLSGHVNLRWLSLCNTMIVDYSPISGLERLRELYLSDDERVMDLSLLSGVDLLWGLHLKGLVGNVERLPSLNGLEALIINTDNYSTISLPVLEKVYQVEIEGENITNVTNLDNVPHLGRLTIHGNISDVSHIASQDCIFEINLSGNLIEDIGPIVDSETLFNDRYNCLLRDLNLRRNPLSSESINRWIPILEERGVRVEY